MKYLSLFVLALLLATGCSQNLTSNKVVTSTSKSNVSEQENSEWKLLIGKWHGNQKTSTGDNYEWLVQRESDGNYQIRFKVTKKGKVIHQKEIGEWGASGGIYFTNLKGWIERGRLIPSDPQDPANRDSYKIISLDDKKFTYESLSNHQVFSVERVSDSFELK